MARHSLLLSAITGFVLAGLVCALALLAAEPSRSAAGVAAPRWQETSWPFPMDQWGKGSAFRCAAADCGAEITLYLRPKIGFCKCSGGMTDDADLDRVSDFELFGGALYPQASGEPIRAAWMQGRSRPFAVPGATLLSIGLHDNCDALVASAVVERGALAAAEPAVRRFLNSRIFADWAAATLGL